MIKVRNNLCHMLSISGSTTATFPPGHKRIGYVAENRQVMPVPIQFPGKLCLEFSRSDMPNISPDTENVGVMVNLDGVVLFH